MIRKNFIVKKRSDNGVSTFYCNIEISVQKHTLYEVSILEGKDWDMAIYFACDTFFKWYPYLDKNILITVEKLHTMTIDTSNMVVFYSTIQALSLCFDMPSLNHQIKIKDHFFIVQK